MRWYTYLALKQLLPSGRKFSLQTVFYLLSVVGVTLGVALLVGSQSVMGGFGEVWEKKIRHTRGDAVIGGPYQIADVGPVLRYLDEMPEVKAAAAVAGGPMMLLFRNRPAMPGVIGFDMVDGSKVFPLEEYFLKGQLSDLDDDSIILSKTIADSIGARLGDVVELYTPLMLDRITRDEILLPRELRVVGVFQTEFRQFDKDAVIVSLRLFQELYNFEDRSASKIGIRLEPDVEPSEFTAKINARIQSGNPPPGLTEDFEARTWREVESGFLLVLGVERTLILLMAIPILLVSAFVIVCSQLLSVMSKEREIGLLAALGANQADLIKSYFTQGFTIALVGSGCGVLLAMIFLRFKDNIILTLESWFGEGDLMEEFYHVAELPVNYDGTEIGLILLFAVLLSTLASVVPAYAAARKNPADALRSE